ncbi:MAG: MATE family efflux transporter [Clostridia bacterium]|nr:MATE family efflux transporter [Clostridia bacterium]
MQGIKKFFEPIDMTVGKPWKNILMFAVPMVIGNIAQQLYSTVDSIVVGKYVGDNALAAVGSATPLFNLLLVLFVGISAGVGIMVSQYFGAKARKELTSTISTCVVVTAVSSLFIMILAPFIVRPLLALFKTPPEILDDCTNYLVILMYGVAGMAYYNILSGILRGLGDSFWSLMYLLVATVLNIGLDILFVAEFDMGVAGVSVATVIAQFVASALCMWKLMRMKDIFSFGSKELKVSALSLGKMFASMMKNFFGRIFHYCKYIFRFKRPRAYQKAVSEDSDELTMTRSLLHELVKLGVPSGLTQAIFSCAMIVVQSLTNSFGTEFIAANVIVMRVDGFAMMPNFSFGTAMTTYAGQNVGAGRIDRVKTGAKHGTLIAMACSAIITFIILVFGKYLMMIFTDTASLVDRSVYMMRILAVGYIAMAVTQSLSGVMRGAGDTMTPMWISLFTTVILRVPLAYGISWFTRTPDAPYGTSDCIQISLLTSWVVGALLTTLFYCIGKWKTKASRFVNQNNYQ